MDRESTIATARMGLIEAQREALQWRDVYIKQKPNEEDWAKLYFYTGQLEAFDLALKLLEAR